MIECCKTCRYHTSVDDEPPIDPKLLRVCRCWIPEDETIIGFCHNPELDGTIWPQFGSGDGMCETYTPK